MAKILIVEDNTLNMRLAVAVLKNAGHEPVQACNAEVGIDLARRERPALILMDIQLPGMDGLAATRELKRDAATRDIPVIAVTAYLAEHSEEEVRAAGCAGFIAKPYHHAELLAAVKAALGG